MQDVQNLRKAIYEFVSFIRYFLPSDLILFLSYKLKVDACEKGTVKEKKLRSIAVNYLWVIILCKTRSSNKFIDIDMAR